MPINTEEYIYFVEWVVLRFLKRFPFLYYLKDDLIQESLCWLEEDKESYDPNKSQVTTFIYNNLTHRLLNYMLRDKSVRSDLTESQFEVWHEMPQEQKSFEDLIDFSEVSQDKKKILVWYFVCGYTQKEIAEKLGVTQQRVQKVLSNTINLLRRLYFMD